MKRLLTKTAVSMLALLLIATAGAQGNLQFAIPSAICRREISGSIHTVAVARSQVEVVWGGLQVEAWAAVWEAETRISGAQSTSRAFRTCPWWTLRSHCHHVIR